MNSCDIVPQVASSIATITSSTTDPDWHDTSVLLAELATLNRRISRYITQMLDADARRRLAVDVAEQAALGWQLIELGQVLRDRAEAADLIDSEVTQSEHPTQGSTRSSCTPLTLPGERFRKPESKGGERHG